MRMKSVIVLVVLMWLAPAWAAPDTGPGAASGGLTDVAGIKLGHYTLDQRPTGCTVILVEDGAVAGVDVRGSAPGTRETDLLRPTGLVDQVHAVVLAGGSAFGLAAASGVVQYLEERGIGFVTPTAKVPIVPAAILYDLGVGDASIRPTAECGYRAARAATDGPVVEGNVGAGAGATVGKLAGAGRAMKSGLGTASISLADGLTVAALVAVNAVGDIIDPHTNRVVAGLAQRGRHGLGRQPSPAAPGRPDPGPECRKHDAWRRGHQRAADQGRGHHARPDGPRRFCPRHQPGPYAV